MTDIGDYAFGECYGLTRVVIGSGVVGVGEGLFDCCESLEGVYFKGDAPWRWWWWVLADPEESEEDYAFDPADLVLGDCPATVYDVYGTEGAGIRFTTNGVDPTASSALYSGSFNIYATTTVKARAFMVDGIEQARVDGDGVWRQVSVTLASGSHTLRWTFSKDDEDETVYEDCGWVDQIVWTPVSASTTTAEVPVPYAWLEQFGLVTGGNYEAAALADADWDGLGLDFAREVFAAMQNAVNDPSVWPAIDHEIHRCLVHRFRAHSRSRMRLASRM